MRRLLMVEEAFQVSGRGTVLVPPVQTDPRWPATIQLELRRPDGTTIRTAGHVRGESLYRAVGCAFVWTLCLDIPKTEVPIGTEIFAS